MLQCTGPVVLRRAIEMNAGRYELDFLPSHLLLEIPMVSVLGLLGEATNEAK